MPTQCQTLGSQNPHNMPTTCPHSANNMQTKCKYNEHIMLTSCKQDAYKMPAQQVWPNRFTVEQFPQPHSSGQTDPPEQIQPNRYQPKAPFLTGRWPNKSGRTDPTEQFRPSRFPSEEFPSRTGPADLATPPLPIDQVTKKTISLKPHLHVWGRRRYNLTNRCSKRTPRTTRSFT